MNAALPWTIPQRTLAGAGVLALLGAWLGPLPHLAQHSFAAHMSMHMAVVAVAAPLLAVGLAGSRFDPATRFPGLFSPMLATLLEFVVVWAWHAPWLHHAARASGAMRALEQGSFLAVGLLLWLAACGGPGLAARGRAVAGIAALLMTAMHMSLLGVLLAGGTRPLYPHGDASGAAPMAVASALADQHLGGILMLAVGGIAYLAGALWLLSKLLRDQRGSGDHA